MATEMKYDVDTLKENHFGTTDPIHLKDYKKNILTNTKIDKEEITIFADLCGVEKENINVELTGKTLRINAERKFNYESGLHNDEICIGNLCRLIELEEEVDGENSKSSFENGLLIIKLQRISKPETIIIPMI